MAWIMFYSNPISSVMESGWSGSLVNETFQKSLFKWLVPVFTIELFSQLKKKNLVVLHYFAIIRPLQWYFQYILSKLLTFTDGVHFLSFDEEILKTVNSAPSFENPANSKFSKNLWKEWTSLLYRSCSRFGRNVNFC